ncbi:MAG: hypothetical protein IT306_26585 [Chloroflexi bacterium]|nr:hypothetical protein [Chloroflexota bacterium]
MVQIGVFLVVEADHPFHRAVSSILGYEIWSRVRQASSLAPFLDAATLTSWLGGAPPYGVHCTITGGAIEYADADLDEIEARTAWIASRVAPFTLTNGRFYDDFHAAPEALVARFDSADGALDRLHRLLATTINSLHTATFCSPPPATGHARLHELYVRFGEARALERFAPHWTLMSGLPDRAAFEQARALIQEHTGLFADPGARTLEIRDIHLVQRGDDGLCYVAASYPLTGVVRR